MTLRARLVVALVVLLTVGLAVFGLATHRRYEASERRTLDRQLRSLIDDAVGQLTQLGEPSEVGSQASGPLPRGDRRDRSNRDRRPVVISGLYAQARSPNGEILAETTVLDPPTIDVTVAPNQHFTSDGTNGEQWRGWSELRTGPRGRPIQILVAVPTSDLDDRLRELATIGVIGGTVLVTALGLGAWLVIRQTLKPLTAMAVTAHDIEHGALDQRADVGGRADEVGQLGSAFNSMLDRIQAAFAERDATEAKLRQFVADAAHEMRTPLTSIRGFAELARLEHNNPDLDQPLAVRRIEEESSRLTDLVDELLLLAQLDQRAASGATSAAGRTESVDVAVVAAEACTAAKATEPDRPIQLQTAGDTVIIGDRGQLRQVLDNLLANALKHTDSRIDVDVTEHADVVIVGVRDYGVGLDSVAKERAFDRFWQADPARVGGGAGLGLSIVRSVVQAHGGTVDVEDALGGGAVFTVRLPRQQPQLPSAD
jgi:two-component system, OmpR family, sensor kinase